MIIDDLPSISIANDSDEIAIEQGTATKKITKGNFLQEVTGAISSLLSSLSGKVSKAGDTMTGMLKVESAINSATYFDAKNTAYSLSDLPSGFDETIYSLVVQDKANNNIGYVRNFIKANGSTTTELVARNLVNGSGYTNSISLTVGPDGTRAVSVASPAAWLSALGLGSVETGESGANLFTVANGFTLTEATCYKWGHVVEINLNITKTTAVTTPTFFTLGTIKVANKCPITVATAGSTDSALVNAYVLISGQVNCYVTSWAANTSKRIIATYLSP